jgi:hypothetical protein
MAQSPSALGATGEIGIALPESHWGQIALFADPSALH